MLRVDEVRALEIGVRGSAPVPVEANMITGDQNIVDVQLLVQYNIKNSRDFLFKAVDPAGITIKDAAETSLRQVVGERAIDDVLTTEKEAVQADTELKLQALLDLYQTGINVTEVKLLNVRPPEQVQDAFDDVVRAREDKDPHHQLGGGVQRRADTAGAGRGGAKDGVGAGVQRDARGGGDGASQPIPRRAARVSQSAGRNPPAPIP